MKRSAHTLRKHHLHDVAVQDVLFGAIHGGLETGLAKFGHGIHRLAPYRGGGTGRLVQLRGQGIKPRLCIEPSVRLHRVSVNNQR